MKNRNDIAIIGIGCRFPGNINTPADFWDFVKQGKDGIGPIPRDRINLDMYYHPEQDKNGSIYIKKGGFLTDIDHFDPHFFGISPREAASMDPQQRLLLETTWEALEDGGINPQHLAGSDVGVFVGIFMHDFENIHTNPSENTRMGYHTATGMSTTIAANRISYVFDFIGPSMVVDTACSSSLVTVHLACQSLINNESSIALAGGANVLLSPEMYMSLCRAHMLSPDGYCKSFDAAANGYVRSEGVAMIALKKLSRALHDNDPIYAVIKGSAVNQDGKSESITFPNGESQKKAIMRALHQAGLTPDDLHYIEAHGTGTPAGDPVELHAIGDVLREHNPDREDCYIGSVKSNFGHTESTAGVAGLIKVALMMQHRKIPPNLHFTTPNPAIDFTKYPLKVPVTLTDWETGTHTKRMAGINSFGFGGTNAHIIMEEYHDDHPKNIIVSHHTNKMYIVPISAHKKEALQRYYHALYDRITGDDTVTLDDLVHSLIRCKGQHNRRAAFIVNNRDELMQALHTAHEGYHGASHISRMSAYDDGQKMVFVYSGMGQQWWAMARTLITGDPDFKNDIMHIDSMLQQYRHDDWSLLQELLQNEDKSLIHKTENAQPAIFAIQAALSNLWKRKGIIPELLIGHSVGEVAAAYAAGVYTLEDAVKIIHVRSVLQAKTAGQGKMLAVGMSEAAITPMIEKHRDRVSIAAINSADSVTLSGDETLLTMLCKQLEDQGVFVRLLKVEVPYHSPKMDPILAELRSELADITPRKTEIPLVSTVTGELVMGTELTNDYWCDNVRLPVYFKKACLQVLHLQGSIFLEIAAHPVLAMNINECITNAHATGLVIHSLRRNEPDLFTIHQSLAHLYCWGYPMDWTLLYNQNARFIKLPKIPFIKERSWHESTISLTRRTGIPASHPYISMIIDGPGVKRQVDLNLYRFDYLRDHQVQGSVVFPAAGFIELALAAGIQHFKTDALVIEAFTIEAPLLLHDIRSNRVQVSIDDQKVGIHSKIEEVDNTWNTHCSGTITTLKTPISHSGACIDEIRDQDMQKVSHATVYHHLSAMGLQYGPEFQVIQELHVGNDVILGRIQCSSRVHDQLPAYLIHPVILDGAFQILASLPVDGTYLPVGIERLEYHEKPHSSVWVHGTIVSKTSRYFVGDITIQDETGTVFVAVKGLRCAYVEGTRSKPDESLNNLMYQYEWLDSDEHTCAFTGNEEMFTSLQKEIHARLEELTPLFERERFYRDIEPHIDHLCTRYIIKALKDLGLDINTGGTFCIHHINCYDRCAPEHKWLLRRFLQILEADGYLKKQDETYTVQKTYDTLDTQHYWQSIMDNHPHYQAELLMLNRFGDTLADVITGARDPLEMLFPQNSTLTEQFYRSSPSMRFYNTLIQELFLIIKRITPENRKIKILEIGAGTGSLTSFVLPVLPESRVDYTYTDISRAFLNQANMKFSRYPFIDYQVLDIGNDPLAQGFHEKSYDVVIASDAIHVTEYLETTLGYIKKLLKNDGLFILLEQIKKVRWFDLVFGTLKGWWEFKDLDMRKDHVLMSRDQWVNLLHTCDFAHASVITESIEEYQSEHGVFIAQKGRDISEQSGDTDDPIVDRTTPAIDIDKYRWIVLKNDDPIANRVVDVLQRYTGKPLILEKADEYTKISSDHYMINPLDPASMKQFFKEPAQETDKDITIINLWNITGRTTAHRSIDQIEALSNNGVIGLLNLVQALNELPRDKKIQLCLVTNGVINLSQTQEQNLEQSCIWGFGRVIISEHNKIATKLIDLDITPDTGQITSLIREILSTNQDDEICLRNNKRLVHRLKRSGHLKSRTIKTNYRLVKDHTMELSGFHFQERPRKKPQLGTVEVAVRATGLNFKELAGATGIIDVDANDMNQLINMGLEGSGVVTAVPEGEDRFAVGDAVMGLMNDTYSSHCITDPRFLVKKPNTLSFTEAATIPVVFLTASYLLHHVCTIKPGDTVVIHTASGGMGLAAIQVARAGGAHIYATAGTDEKRDFLRSIGITHVYNSRDIEFYDRIMEHTRCKGVDFVINTLPGDAMTAGIKLLKPATGVFMELSNMHSEASLKMQMFKKGLTFFAFDLANVTYDQPEVIAHLLSEITQRFERGTYHPLPHRIYPIGRVQQAFTYFKDAKHIGKIVLHHAEGPVSIIPDHPGLTLDPDGVYLISGGFGGLGIATAEWLIDCGAKKVALAGRSGGNRPREQEAIARLHRRGATIIPVTLDVTIKSQVKEAITFLERTAGPLKGIIHGAMVLEDGYIDTMTADQIRKVMNPKVLGAWNLHMQSLHCTLDFFICYSSVASMIGNAGQANYSAANLFLDHLAHYRRALDLPANTFCWGAVGEVGYVSHHKEIEELFDRQGLKPLSLQQIWKAIVHAVRENRPLVGVTWVDWDKLSRYSPAVARSLRFKRLKGGGTVAGDDTGNNKAEAMMDIHHNPEDYMHRMEHNLYRNISRILGIDADKLDTSVSLDNYGLDSLMSVELNAKIQELTGLDMPKMLLLQKGLTIESLIATIRDTIIKENELDADILRRINEKKQLLDSDTFTGDQDEHTSSPNIMKEPDISIVAQPKPSGYSRKEKTAQAPVESQTADISDVPGKSGYKIPREFYELGERFKTSFDINFNDLYFHPSQGINTNKTVIHDKEFINYCSYNYIGLSGNQSVIDFAKQAIDRYGTSVSASRLASGGRPIHLELEKEIAGFLSVEDSIVFVGGFLTNETVVGTLVNEHDLIIYDSYIHASIQQGARLSGAAVKGFPHNNYQALEHILRSSRGQYHQILILVEGVYSMDGDIPDLPKIIALKKEYGAVLMVDEAHSIGVLGKTGRGIGEYFGVSPTDVDIWMGTLSKSFASCGGYVAGERELIEYIKYTTPGFIFSAGMPPSNAAAALAGIRVLKEEPERIERLHENVRYFLGKSSEAGIDTGLSKDTAVIPVIVGNSKRCIELYRSLYDEGIYALPMVYPTVPENAARIRFFMSCLHTKDDIDKTIDVLKKYY